MSNSAHTACNAPATLSQPLRPLLAQPEKACRLRIHFTVFFDGTNNNLKEDESNGSHSNVARLYKAAIDDKLACIHRLYVPGVGTPFEDIGEVTPHPRGASMGKMGAERIRYALLAIANRIKFVLDRQYLVPEDKAHLPSAVSSDAPFARWCLLLKLALRHRPVIEEVVVDVFGFSRGAAAARSFVNQLLKHFCDAEGRYCGIRLHLRFMGLFDTVASVGLADSFPLPGVEGHQDWGDQDLLVIPPQVQQCVHFVAGHEGRNSFPVDLILGKDGKYPKNCVEIVYPGVHSDVGGGYGPGDQGKSSRQDQLLSQIALNDMYERACKAGVLLLDRGGLDRAGLKDEFAVCPDLRSTFDRYLGELRPLVHGKPAVQHLKQHRRYYVSWRRRVLSKATFDHLPFVQSASPQDRTNLIAANDELGAQVARWEANARVLDRYDQILREPSTRYPAPAPSRENGVAYYRQDWAHAPFLEGGLAGFFELYVHDSRAGFLLTDPIKERDHIAIRERLEHKERNPVYEAKTGMRLNPLSPREREVLEIYRKGGRPIYTDDQPASSSDGVTDALDAVAAMSRRREMSWTYLHPRQVFAYDRVSY